MALTAITIIAASRQRADQSVQFVPAIPRTHSAQQGCARLQGKFSARDRVNCDA
jgi:hypothetical protein